MLLIVASLIDDSRDIIYNLKMFNNAGHRPQPDSKSKIPQCPYSVFNYYNDGVKFLFLSIEKNTFFLECSGSLIGR